MDEVTSIFRSAGGGIVDKSLFAIVDARLAHMTSICVEGWGGWPQRPGPASDDLSCLRASHLANAAS